MLSKVDVAQNKRTVTINWEYVSSSSFRATGANLTIPSGYIGKHRFVFNGFSSSTYANYGIIATLMRNNTEYKKFNETEAKNIDNTLSVENGSYYIKSTVGGTSDKLYLNSPCYSIIEYWKSGFSGKKIKVYVEKQIGQKLTGYLFGMLPTGERRNGE